MKTLIKTILSGLLLSAATLSAAAAGLGGLSHIHGIAAKPDDPQHLYVATHHGLYLVGRNGNIQPLSDSRDDFMGFSPHPDDPRVLFASGHPAGGGNLGFIVSTDGGKTWHRRAPGVNGPVDFHAMAVSHADPQVIYGTHGGLQVSQDGGESWQLVGPLPARIYTLAAPADAAGHLYAGSDQGLLESRDGGQTWRPAAMFRTPVPALAVGPDDTLYAYLVKVGLLRGENGNWTRIDGDLGDRLVLQLAVDPSDAQHLYAATRDKELLESRDGGQSWQPFINGE